MSVRTILLCVALAACHATTADPPQTAGLPSPPDASIADAASPTAIFHLSQIDETNLSLLPNGSFVWQIFGCDFSGGGDGHWITVAPGHFQLLPSKGKTFVWPGQGGVGGVTSVDVETTPTGELHTHTVAVTGPLDQSWKPGRVCAVCGGGLGPSRSPVLCNRPFP